MIIEQPCTTCGIPLEKGVKFITVFEMMFGAVSIITWAVLFHTSKLDKKNHNKVGDQDKNEDKYDIIPDESDFNGFFFALLLFSILQFVLSFVLLIGVTMKNRFVIHVWILASAVTCLTSGVLPKIYEMIVVYAYSEELASDAHGVALAAFQKLPYVCNIEMQHYPPPAYGLKRTKESGGKKNTAFLQRKSIFMNVPPIFQSRH